MFWKALKVLRANTAELPVYWNLLEPEEGRFSFTQTDQILARARDHGVKLIVLWFGTWKNGKMQYCPGWVKENPGRFHRVITHDGVKTGVLSSHCKENLEADKRAFSALMEHIRQTDKDGTVIAVQMIENEPGIDARTGKEILNVPLIVNVRNGDAGFNQPGLDYPSGGAAAKVLDLWKLASPDIDIIGPDIYLANIKQFDAVCSAFNRPDNPLFIPESPRRKCNEWGIISAVGRHHAVGYCMFGIEGSASGRRHNTIGISERSRQFCHDLRRYSPYPEPA